MDSGLAGDYQPWASKPAFVAPPVRRLPLLASDRIAFDLPSLALLPDNQVEMAPGSLSACVLPVPWSPSAENLQCKFRLILLELIAECPGLFNDPTMLQRVEDLEAAVA